ncbi:ChbG/HpnK family deacetylase [Bordetella petrii]|uniref:ChbG/HpnK family deacetylase n=1 Tax=Bordetella petrii TaxID=94624 RepID=UPI001F604540|nr:ChbG/HpnK family deacetylase [Bordetella petrii]
MSSGIDAGILQLIKLDRLSAISCLVHGPTFVVNGRRLNDADLDVGLHLNLTAAFGGTSQPNVLALRTLIGRVYSGRLERAWVDNQLLRQFDTFEKTLGRPPDYIDGHQHVHQLPGVLPRLLCILRERYRGRRKPWLRYTAPGLLTGIPILDSAKAHLIGALGADEVARAARCEGWPINRRMLGIYRFQGGERRYARLLHHWLNNARDGDLLICHPGLPIADDMSAAQRLAEYEVLARPELGDWMRLSGVRIAKRPIR